MTRSIFDPDGGETERSGSTHMGPDAANLSHLPPEVVDGEVEEDDENHEPFAFDPDEAARRLQEMSAGDASGDSTGDASEALPDDAAGGDLVDPSAPAS